jgi:DNA-binding response OmpR family regulator
MSATEHSLGFEQHRTPAAHWPPRGASRVLLVIPSVSLIELIKLTLNHGVYVTRLASSRKEAAHLLDEWQPHLVVFECDVDGSEVLKLIGTRGSGASRLPSICLTRRGNLQSKLEAFEAGVDDILTVPFAPEELLARTIAVLRRSYRNTVTFTPVIRIGELEIDILHRTVSDGESELHLTALEQSLLYLLASNAGRVVSRDEILDTLWGGDYVPESNVVDRQVRNLRMRLQDDWKQPRFIATVPGRGYRFLQTLAATT